jgi:hypothetical protein
MDLFSDNSWEYHSTPPEDAKKILVSETRRPCHKNTRQESKTKEVGKSKKDLHEEVKCLEHDRNHPSLTPSETENR